MADEEHATRLELGKADLRGANLVGVNLIRADLRSVDLRGVDLREANLREADLFAADLSNANLGGANLAGANLSDADLSHADLRGADLSGADLRGADLTRAALSVANLMNADLRSAYLISAHLSGANLAGANLRDANLRGARLINTNLTGAILAGADLTEAHLAETGFANVALGGAIGLETCHHEAPSTLDHRTLKDSGSLPLAFLRGAGLPDNLIDFLPSLSNQAVQFYSCFISYSAKDEEFAFRLHADLQATGVRCWFAPHDLPIGARIFDEIDASIRLRDKMLLILSDQSIKSDWVENEVTMAFEEERKRGQTVLFPLRIDDAIMEVTSEPWAAKLRADRHIGDFRHWKAYDAYKKSLERLLRDLTKSEGSSK